MKEISTTTKQKAIYAAAGATLGIATVEIMANKQRREKAGEIAKKAISIAKPGAEKIKSKISGSEEVQLEHSIASEIAR